MPRRPPKAPILIVLHQEHSTPGRVGRLLRERGFPPRHPPPALRRSAAGDPGRTCGRGDLRRADERQRSGRFRQGGDRLDRGSAQGEQALSRPLPRRADDGEAPRSQRLGASRGPRRDRLLPAAADGGGRCPERGLGRALAEPCLSLAPGGLRLPRRRRDPGDRRRLSDPGDPGRAGRPSASSSTRRSPTP